MNDLPLDSPSVDSDIKDRLDDEERDNLIEDDMKSNKLDPNWRIFSFDKAMRMTI
jgi:hypothetical protein